MIARTWQATATPSGAQQYEAHFRNSVLPALRSYPGFRGAYLMQRTTNNHVQIQVLTRWESEESIADFVGTYPDTAVVEPEARAVLLHFDKTVRHYGLSEFSR